MTIFISSFSSAGKKQFAAHILLFIVNIVVMALAAQINQYQEYFYIADLFPLILSILTFVILTVLITLDVFTKRGFYTGYAQTEIVLFSVLTIMWLAFNAFSTARWSGVPSNCGVIPDKFSDVRMWCSQTQALKGFVWVEWVLFFFSTILTLRYVVAEAGRGNKHIFRMALSRYTPSPNTTTNTNASLNTYNGTSYDNGSTQAEVYGTNGGYGGNEGNAYAFQGYGSTATSHNYAGHGAGNSKVRDQNTDFLQFEK